jgi:tRNA dimethylallyltransferase
MNVALYASMAREAAEDIAARGRAVLVVGGAAGSTSSPSLRQSRTPWTSPSGSARVAAAQESGGLAGLVAELSRLNPGGLGGLDTANPRRVAAALGRCLASGRTLAELSSDFARLPLPSPGWEVRLVRLERSGPDLEARIAARVDAMLRPGLVDEVLPAPARRAASNPSAARAIGYRETIEVLDGARPDGGPCGGDRQGHARPREEAAHVVPHPAAGPQPSMDAATPGHGAASS